MFHNIEKIENHKSKFNIRLSSDWERFDDKDYNILGVDEVGILADLYSISTTAYICGTHWKENNGGQNPLEPAFYGVRMISGPNWSNNSDAFEGLKKSGLLEVVRSDKGFIHALNNPPSEEELEIYRKNANEFIKSKQGYAESCARKIKKEFRL